jgi:cytoskeletal protein RodZ
MLNRILIICLIVVLMIIGGTYLYNTVTSHSSAQTNTRSTTPTTMSGSTPTPVPPSTPTQPVATPAASTPPSTSKPTQPVATPTAITAVSICQTNQLALAYDKSDGLVANRGDQFSLQNTSASTCTLDGYPDVQMLLATNQPTPTQEMQVTGSYFFASPVQIQTVSLQPGAKAYFVISWVAGQCAQPAVTAGIYIQVTPPGDTGTLTASTSAGADGGIDACGTIRVSPISATSVLL